MMIYEACSSLSSTSQWGKPGKASLCYRQECREIERTCISWSWTQFYASCEVIPFILPVSPKRKYSTPILQIRTLSFRVVKCLVQVRHLQKSLNLIQRQTPVDGEGSGGV